MFDTKKVQIIDFGHANKHPNTREKNFVKSGEDFLGDNNFLNAGIKIKET